MSLDIGRFVDGFLNPAYFQNALQLRKARLLVRACFLTSFFSTSYVLFSVIFDFERAIYFTAFNVIGYFALPFLLKTRIPFAIISNIFPAIGALTVEVLTWYSGGMWSAIYPWIIAVPVLALLVVGKTPAIFWSVFSFLSMIAFGLLELNGISLPVEFNVELRTVWYLSIIPGLLLIIMVVSFTFEHSMQRALEDVEAQRVTIEKQSHELHNLIEDKDNIIRILAHDLKNPLANISLLTRLLEREETSGSVKEIVGMIGGASANAQILVKHVLEMATLEHRDTGVSLMPTSCNELVSEVVHSFKQTSEDKSIPISLPEFNGDYKVMANPTYFRLALENLVSNAVKFSNAGEAIDVRLIDVADHIQIHVRDRGPGVPVEEEIHLFKKFSRLSVKPTAGESSSGLGLSLVKRYMELMNGRVWYERPHDGGAVFAIELKKA